MGQKCKPWHNGHRKRGEQRHFRRKSKFDKTKRPAYVPPSDASEIYDIIRAPDQG